MSKTDLPTLAESATPCAVAVIWIDWYPYHVARFMGLQSAPGMAGHVAGIELVGGVGVHAGLKFREDLPSNLPITTLMPEADWQSAGQLRLSRKLWSALGRLDPQIVLVPGYYTLPAIAAALWARLHGRCPVLMTESTAGDHARVGWREKAKSLLIHALFDWAIAGGSAHRRYLAQLGFPEDRIKQFYDVVDNHFFRTATLEYRALIDASPRRLTGYVLYIGRLSEEKNVDGLLAEWITYRAGGGTWPLILVGDGSAAQQLRETAAQSRFADDVHFAGHKTIRELPEFYAFANCFVLPSTREPWGLVVNEAMASGLPVIVSNRCGCAEDLVLEGSNGYTFNPALVGALAERLLQLENAGSEQLRHMSTRSIEIIAHYSPQAFGEQVGSITTASDFKDLLQNSYNRS